MALIIWIIIIFMVAAVTCTGFIQFLSIVFLCIMAAYALHFIVSEQFWIRKMRKTEAMQRLRAMEEDQRRIEEEIRIQEETEKWERILLENTALDYCNRCNLEFESLCGDILTTIQDDTFRVSARVAIDRRGNLICTEFISTQRI